jgi:hypothetical protein
MDLSKYEFRFYTQMNRIYVQKFGIFLTLDRDKRGWFIPERVLKKVKPLTPLQKVLFRNEMIRVVKVVYPCSF